MTSVGFQREMDWLQILNLSTRVKEIPNQTTYKSPLAESITHDKVGRSENYNYVILV